MKEEAFEEFMARALHDPEIGYYARQIAGIGLAGDFTTAPLLSSLLARAVAGWVVSAVRVTSYRHVIELGAGDGSLAAEVRASLPSLLRLSLKFHVVETSAPLTTLQRVRLGKRVAWHRDLADALQACGGEALVYSNEFVDAFPVRRFERGVEGWHEIFLRWHPSQPLPEEFTRATTLPESTVFALEVPLAQRVEVHESYCHYLQRALPHWSHGRLLTIDYGSEVASLYRRRLQGSLRGYLYHQMLEGREIYRHPGRLDLTADVNFTDLQVWSAPWVEASRLLPFHEFASNYLTKPNAIDRALVDPAGAGGAFMVLEQRVGRQPSAAS